MFMTKYIAECIQVPVIMKKYNSLLEITPIPITPPCSPDPVKHGGNVIIPQIDRIRTTTKFPAAFGGQGSLKQGGSYRGGSYRNLSGSSLSRVPPAASLTDHRPLITSESFGLNFK